jgi:hypothetical protein
VRPQHSKFHFIDVRRVAPHHFSYQAGGASRLPITSNPRTSNRKLRNAMAFALMRRRGDRGEFS